jgi:S-layer homology domain
MLVKGFRIFHQLAELSVMTQSPNPNNNNRRRRLTADELIAILVAMTGIGGIFWWVISHRTPNQGFFQANSGQSANVRTILPLTEDPANPQPTSGDKFTKPKTLATPAQAAGAAAPDVVVGNTAEAPGTMPTVLVPPVVPPITVAPTQAATPVPRFTDVPDKYFGKSKIEVLQSMGVLQDFGGGKFDPNLPITRGEYAKMLDRAFPDRATIQQVLEFKDIPANYARREALDRSVKMGFMTGYSKTLFKPDEKIPRYQMQISLAKGMNLKPPADAAGVLKKFTDLKGLPEWAKPKTAAAIGSGLIVNDGQANKLQPVKATTRGEAATLIYEALVREGKIKPSK